MSRILFRKFTGPRTRRLGLNTFLKRGHRIDLAEAETLAYVAEHTSIPVPKVRRACCSDEITYIVMDLVDGVELSSVWYKMSGIAKRRVIDQLKDYLAQLRSLKPPTNGAIASVNSGPLRDIPRVGVGQFGPFANQDEFHHFLRAGCSLDMFKDMEGGHNFINTYTQQYEIKFTHGDLAPRNIMVKKDGTVTGLIDWDCAGWYPEYWEYTKANFILAPDDWISSTGEMTGRYEDQLAGETWLQNRCGILLTS
ncbi:kinase-like domain-containing protein [Crucibulum laeve]|uniref:Kinase-like domain-containing protein n=1 Tax=Crucibulum laeve TaxID=68775 RepID=A0A5C3LPA4_9AGAR|nr:kinase-like domain-containing protein [Crucibulum laeve]